MSPEERQEKLNDLKIGWIGVGKMGSPMARNLQKAGFTVVVYDADLSRLTDSGFERAQSVEALSRETDIVISMIPNDQALREIVLGPDRIRLGPGKLFVDLSTVRNRALPTVFQHLGKQNLRGWHRGRGSIFETSDQYHGRGDCGDVRGSTGAWREGRNRVESDARCNRR